MFLKSLGKALENLWPMLIIFVVVLVVTRIFYIKNNKRETVLYKEILALLFIIYLLLLFELVTNTETAAKGINLVPFTEIFRYTFGSKLFLYNVIGNIIVFIPFGYFISSYIKSKGIGPIFSIALITSLTIELVQLKIGRAFDIDDIILNVTGGIIGFLLYVGLDAIKKRLPALFQRDWIYNIICVFLLLGVLLYLGKMLGFVKF